MIRYDGKYWRNHLSLNGSVIVRAMPWAVVPSCLAYLIRHAHGEGWIDLESISLIVNNAAFTGFQFTLGFVLVFRAGQCYTRFWSCAESACVMRSQLAEAASSLTAFTAMSKQPKEKIDDFLHKIVRLVSLLHAVALQNIADQEDENYLVIDPGSIGEDRLCALGALDGDARVDVVYQWITNLIIRSMDDGVINVPPPITSRVFQELEKGMVEYQQVLQTMSIPFPFPYAQVAVVLLWFYMICAPFVMCYYVGQAFVAAGMTFISVTCYVTIEMICSELEYPLGDDANDLPTHEWQIGLNKSLLGLLHPLCSEKFELENPIMDLGKLEDVGLVQLSEFLEPRPLRADVVVAEMQHVMSTEERTHQMGATMSTQDIAYMGSQLSHRDFKPPKNGARQAQVGKRKMRASDTGVEAVRSDFSTKPTTERHKSVNETSPAAALLGSPKIEINVTDLPPELPDTANLSEGFTPVLLDAPLSREATHQSQGTVIV